MSGARPLSVLMRPADCVDIKWAADYAGKTDKTIRRWIKRFGIARQAMGHSPLEVSLPALEMVMHGDVVALELLRAGQRAAPEVRRYLEFLGLPE